MNLRELIALNDELLALVRAGIPVHLGLAESLGGGGRRLARVSQELQQRLQAGQSLSDVMAAQPEWFPPVYTALVRAGMRSGRLPSALEAWSELAQRMAELRSFVRVATIYPLFVFTLACVLFSWLTPQLATAIEESYRQLRHQQPAGQAIFLSFIGTWGAWMWTLPVGLVAAGLIARFWPTGSTAPGQQRSSWLNWVPWFGKVTRSTQAELMCRSLADLLEQDVPLDEALLLAVRITGSGGQLRQAQDLVERVRAGDVTNWQPAAFPQLPGQMVWAVRHQRSPAGVAATLRRSAGFYQHQAELGRLCLQTYVPIILMAVLGASVAGSFIISFLVPWSRLLFDMATQMSPL